MSRKIVIAVAGAVLGLGLAVSTAHAAPGTLAPLQAATNTDSIIHKAHGFHRSCVRHRGWWHRHVGRGRTVACGPRLRRYRHCFRNRRGDRVCVWRNR